jgi:hypothetical protein
MLGAGSRMVGCCFFADANANASASLTRVSRGELEMNRTQPEGGRTCRLKTGGERRECVLLMFEKGRGAEAEQCGRLQC